MRFFPDRKAVGGANNGGSFVQTQLRKEDDAISARVAAASEKAFEESELKR